MAAAHSAFVRGDFSDAAKRYGLLLDCDSLSLQERTVLLCNRAAAYAAMDLNRKALNDADAALALDAGCLRALLIKGRASMELGRTDVAVDTWVRGASAIDGDVVLVAEMAKLVAQQAAPVSTPKLTALMPMPPPVPPPASTPAPPPTPPTAPRPAPPPAALEATDGVRDEKSDHIAIHMRQAVALFNAGKNVEARKLFTNIIKVAPHHVGALSGRGTAHAVDGELELARRDLDAAQELRPGDVDLMARRLQVLQALGERDLVIVVATEVLAVDARDTNALFMRGKAYHALQNYRRAVLDFEALLHIAPTGSTAVFNLLGTSLAAMGRCAESIRAYEQTLKLDPSLKEVYINLGQAHRDLGQVHEAEVYFSRAVDMQRGFVHSHYRRALLRHVAGRTAMAIEDLVEVVRIEPAHMEARALLAISYAACNDFGRAAQAFEQLLERDPQHPAYHQYVFTLILCCELDAPRSVRRICSLVPAEVKLGMCKQLPAATAAAASKASLAEIKKSLGTSARASVGDTRSEDVTSLLLAARPFGTCMQVRLAGFVENLRLQRAAGLAVLDVAQQLRLLWARGVDKSKTFGWRSAYDVAVCWRQLGEPNDNVWWIDGMPRRDFEEGFGSHTPILKGQHETVRYYPHHPRVFSAMKALAAQQWLLDDEHKAELVRAKDCLDIRRLRGRDDYVVSPCSGFVSGQLEGTRLTVQDRPPEGVEVSIRTPLTPSRWSSYHLEMQAAWEHVCDLAVPLLAARGDGPPDDAFVNAVLRITFFWYNFMPLTRGSAAVGWTFLMALLLACGFEVNSPAPDGISLDWEAILTPSPHDFIAATRTWLLPICRRRKQSVDELPSVANTIATYRQMLDALNVPDQVIAHNPNVGLLLGQ